MRVEDDSSVASNDHGIDVPAVEDPERNQFIRERTPMGRWGQPHELAGAVIFLHQHDAHVADVGVRGAGLD